MNKYHVYFNGKYMCDDCGLDEYDVRQVFASRHGVNISYVSAYPVISEETP